MREFRVFLSSPGDAAIERGRADAVVSRLNGEFAGLARLATVRWETERYKAHETFQPQIPAADACDIVVGILRWRLGTPLPPTFPDTLPGGEAYPSGTAYELLTSIDKRHRGFELPDVYVFRYTGGPPLIALGEPEEEAKRAAWTALRGFIARWFETPAGTFEAAFNSYASEDDFERQLETLLRKWLADKVAGGRIVPWPATKRSPFRGLGVFGAKHAPVFFGRAADIRKAMDLWRDYAARGERYLLIIGASGAGKSSLARSGLIPRLTTPGVIPEVDRWRIAALRPGDSSAGPFASLATALFQTEADLPEEEKGRGDALSEIAAGDFKTPAELAAMLAHADASAAQVLVRALDRIAEGMRAAEKFERPVRCDLVLLVDQLDELFAPSVAPETRDAFARLLAALVACGRVWVLTTLRADLYEPMLKVDALKGLKDRGASYDLAPPGAAELAEIVREPARAAALTFETDATSGERLDERLLREADRPDMLPLVQLALTKLWEARVTRGVETILPLAAFEAQGGVSGIIAEAGETALAGLGEGERARLAPLLRRLAAFSRARDGERGPLNIRAVPLAEAAPDAASRRLVDALVEARLLTLTGTSSPATRGRGTMRSMVEGAAAAPSTEIVPDPTTPTDEDRSARAPSTASGGPPPQLRGGPAANTIVRLAHQRVLTDWARAATIVADSADFYRVRDEVEDARRRWEAAGKRGDLLLARGLPLAEARAMTEKYGAELSDTTRGYVAASRRRAMRAQAIGWAAAAVFAVVAVAAGFETKLASDRQADADRQRQIAERSFRAAKKTVDGLIFDIAKGLRDVPGMRNETIRTILETARSTVDGLIANAPNDPQLRHSRLMMLLSFGDTYLRAGDIKDALSAYQQALEISRKLAAQVPGYAQAQHDVSISLGEIGEVKQRAGDRAGALAAYKESLDIARKLATQNPGNAEAQRDLALNLDWIGNVLQQGDQAGALASYQESLDIKKKLAAQDPFNPVIQGDVSISLENIGDVALQAGDWAGALAAYSQRRDIARKFAEQNPANSRAQRQISISLTHIGQVKLLAGDRVGALAAYQECLDIVRKLAEQDPGDAQAQRDVAISLDGIGDVKLQEGDQAGAGSAYQESLDIARKLVAQDPGNAQARRDLSLSLNRIGDAKLLTGDRAGALAAYGQRLDIARKLAVEDPGNAQAQRDVAFILYSIGGVDGQAGDLAKALANYQDSLDIAKKVAAQDPGNADAQLDVSTDLSEIGNIKLRLGDQAGTLGAFKESLAIRRKLAEDPRNVVAQRAVSVLLERIGDVKRQAGDQSGSLDAYKQALDIRQKLAAKDPGNAQAQRDVSFSLVKIGELKRQAGDRVGALAAYQQDLAIAEKLSTRDPANAKARRDVAISLDKIGDLKLQSGDQEGALSAYEQNVGIAKKLAAEDPGDAAAQSALFVGLTKVGDIKLQAGDLNGSLSEYQEGLAIAQNFAARNPDNAAVQSAVAISLGKVGDVKLRARDRAGAFVAYEQGLDITRTLAAKDPGNLQAQRDVALGLKRIGDAKLRADDPASALVAYNERLVVDRKRAALDGPRNAPARTDLAKALGTTADVELMVRDFAQALALSDEAIRLRPDLVRLYTNRAHALMLLGRTDEARVLYLKYRGALAQGNLTWEQSVKNDFAAFRKRGIRAPLMDEIEADFAKPK